MRLFSLCCTVFLLSLALPLDEVDQYLNFLSRNEAALGPFDGEVQILRQRDQIIKAQANQVKLSLQKGLSQEKAELSSKVGVVAEDGFWVVIRDAVRFPNGTVGMYDRVLERGRFFGHKVGSIVLPVDENGRYGLIVTYRHPARSWELELPKGSAEAGESFLDAAKRELLEETGLATEDVLDLGEVAIATVTPSRPRLFLARVNSEKIQKTNLDSGEAIYSVEWFDQKRVREAYRNGFAMVNIRGKKEKIPFRDPMLGHALMLAQSQNKLSI